MIISISITMIISSSSIISIRSSIISNYYNSLSWHVIV